MSMYIDVAGNTLSLDWSSRWCFAEVIQVEVGRSPIVLGCCLGIVHVVGLSIPGTIHDIAHVSGSFSMDIIYNGEIR